MKNDFHGKLFVYGTLMNDKIVRRLIRRVPLKEEATLTDFVAYRVIGQPYPGIKSVPGCHTKGILYRGIRPHEWRALDLYEGCEYIRRPVSVSAGYCKKTAFVYLFKPKYRRKLSKVEWRQH